MINRHGGEIKVASRRGEGTVFTILLPRAAAEATAPATGLPGP
jgi:signal transduction histidine kinase